MRPYPFAQCTQLAWVNLNETGIVTIKSGSFLKCTLLFRLQLPQRRRLRETRSTALPTLLGITDPGIPCDHRDNREGFVFAL